MTTPPNSNVSATITPFRDNVHIRAAQHSDAASISALGSSVFASSFGHAISPADIQTYLSESYSVASVEADMASGLKQYAVAVESTAANSNEKANAEQSDGKLLGFALLTRGTTEECLSSYSNLIELQRLYIDPSAQGLGLGRKLADIMQEWARENGAQWIWLGVWEENVKALGLYRKWGWEVVGDHEFKTGQNVDRDLVMVKKL